MKSPIISLKSSSVLALAVAATLAGVALAQVAAPAAAPAPAATQPVAGPVVAEINGNALTRDKFNEALIKMHGLGTFDQLSKMIVAQNACQTALVSVPDEAVAAVRQDYVDEHFAQFAPKDREMAFKAWMVQQGVSPVAMFIEFRTRACMLALVKDKFPVNEDQIKARFEADHGLRVQVVDVILKDMNQIKDLRAAYEKNNKNIGAAIRELGLRAAPYIIPNNPPADYPKSLKEAAFSSKDGEITAAIPVGAETHALYIDKRIEADNTKLTPELHDQIKASLKTQIENVRASEQLQKLMQQAKIDIKDPMLSEVFGDYMKRVGEVQAAATQAATQAAATTAPAAPKKP